MLYLSKYFQKFENALALRYIHTCHHIVSMWKFLNKACSEKSQKEGTNILQYEKLDQTENLHKT